MRSGLIILGFFASGMLLGYLGWIDFISHAGDMSLYALYLLMFLVGISIGTDLSVLKKIKEYGTGLLSLPLITIAGTLLGSALISPMLTDISTREALAVGAGFGYYSLSSVIIGEIHSESLGVVALLSNIMRELITLLAAPLLLMLFGKLGPLVSGGATSMDTSLPVICRVSGTEFAMVALYHGMVLTVLVPLLVSFILS